MITVQTHGLERVQNQLLRLTQRGENLTPLLKNMGEQVLNSTKERFESSTDPDGNRWASNSPVTFARLLGKSHTNKSGRINARGVNKIMSKKPLILGGYLMKDFNVRLFGNSVVVGTPKKYAAIHQYGASQGQFGRNKRNTPLPWGDIPARPFLGISASDKQILERMVIDYWQIV